MLVLALDTCDARGSVALLRDSTPLHVIAHESTEDYSSWLLPAVERVTSTSGVTLDKVDVYAVAAGPGSFTALRVGLTTVKAWSEAYRRPIAAVSRLAALIEQAARGAAPYLAPFTDAQRGQIFGALYRGRGSAIERVSDETVIAPEQFVESSAAIAGSERIEWISPDPKCVAQTEAWKERQSRSESVQVIAPVLAPAVGRLGYQLALQGKFVDALALDANYVRRSDAEIFWKGGVPRQS